VALHGTFGQTLEVQAEECGQAAFKELAPVSTTTGGAFSYTAKPTIYTSYEAKLKRSTSPAVAVKVAPLLMLMLMLKRLALGKLSVSVSARGPSSASKSSASGVATRSG
jgi:hypothetical protein